MRGKMTKLLVGFVDQANGDHSYNIYKGNLEIGEGIWIIRAASYTDYGTFESKVSSIGLGIARKMVDRNDKQDKRGRSEVQIDIIKREASMQT